MRPLPRLLFVSAIVSATAACTLSNEGIAPPEVQFHYPIAGALSPDANWLYVVNSDFDLKYNGARVNAVDLAAVRACMADTNGIECTDSSVCPTPGSTCVDGFCRCASDADCNRASGAACTHACTASPTGGNNVCTAPAIQTEGPFLGTQGIQINPFATAAQIRPAHGSTPTRLYISVRGDGTLTWIDVNGPNMQCGQSTTDAPLCNLQHRVGHVPGGPRGLVMPPLPVTLDVNSDGYILIVHQESPRARASLFFEPEGDAPRLIHWLGDLSPNLDAIVRAPQDNSTDRTPHYYVFSRLEPTVNQLRVEGDGERSFLYRARGDIPNELTYDVGVRAAVLDPCRPHMYATARPAPADSSTAALSPEQLIDFDITDPENIRVEHTMVLPTGPSNLVAVPPPGMAPSGGCGTASTIVYTVSYDARKLYAIDVTNWREYDQIRTENGPHVPLFDATNYLLYVIDFAAQVVQVIDVDPTHADTYNHVLFTIGDPVPPETT